ncbi:MAG TPA: electron transfer flavoprotein subunit alpha/FixB family protein [Nitrospirota bacterium]|nr:electron transfer flavoprotein subunit alpha/FixB family protein [Nitrospirota bacterium]
MKIVLVAEYRQGKLLETSYELAAFAEKFGAEKAFVLIGAETALPAVNAKVYLADAAVCGEYNPAVHKAVVLEAVKRENPEVIAFVHSSYGWDLAPRVAAALKAAQISEVVAVKDGAFEVSCCNGKMRRLLKASTAKTIVTIQAGAFSLSGDASGTPQVEALSVGPSSSVEFTGYEAAEKKDVDLTKAEVIVSAGRGIGKKDNLPVIAALAEALGGELGASRPVVDAGWVQHGRQVGTTGQTVSPKLYVACGISGAIQHIAGMKKSDFIVAINKDKDAPIGEVADVLVVADVLQFAPVLTARLKK